MLDSAARGIPVPCRVRYATRASLEALERAMSAVLRDDGANGRIETGTAEVALYKQPE
jgi:hypothetical protein